MTTWLFPSGYPNRDRYTAIITFDLNTHVIKWRRRDATFSPHTYIRTYIA